jgi:hypothetical protein
MWKLFMAVDRSYKDTDQTASDEVGRCIQGEKTKTAYIILWGSSCNATRSKMERQGGGLQ